MRKIFCFFLAAGLAFVFYQREKISDNLSYLIAGPCDRPIEYRIGRLDRGYGISNEELLDSLKQATDIWETSVGKDLFIYHPQAKLMVNLIYGERQSMFDNLARVEKDIDLGRKSIETLENEFNLLKSDFEKRLADFNEKIRLFNMQGGISREDFLRLKAEQEALKEEGERLNDLARRLNLSIKEYNAQVGQFNQNLEIFRAAVEARPEAGLYKGATEEIDIFLTSSREELIHTLAHEFGHVLNLPHTDEENSIMYPLTNEVIVPNNQEKQRLLAYCRRRNFEFWLERLKISFEDWFSENVKS